MALLHLPINFGDLKGSDPLLTVMKGSDPFKSKWWIPCVVLFLMGWDSSEIQADEGSHFFETHVRPVLIEKCIGCHGEQKQSGGLRLDSKACQAGSSCGHKSADSGGGGGGGFPPGRKGNTCTGTAGAPASSAASTRA